MMFVKTTNDQLDQYPYTVGDLRRDNPNTSFPKRLTNEMLAAWGVYPVIKTNKPDADYTKNVTESTPVVKGNSWTQVWSVKDATADEIAERIESESRYVRSKRNKLLAETDWVVVFHTEKGTNIPIEWEVYRQALRDITDHVNFPHLQEADWPVKP